jgi:hypothetical protein
MSANAVVRARIDEHIKEEAMTLCCSSCASSRLYRERFGVICFNDISG